MPQLAHPGREITRTEYAELPNHPLPLAPRPALSRPGLEPRWSRFDNREVAATSIWAYVAIGAAGIAVAGFIVLLLLLVWGRRDARSYWDDT
jgi:hypothetical protein